MIMILCAILGLICLPSHEGSGLKWRMPDDGRAVNGLPSHEGSGLKCDQINALIEAIESPLA